MSTIINLDENPRDLSGDPLTDAGKPVLLGRLLSSSLTGKGLDKAEEFDFLALMLRLRKGGMIELDSGELVLLHKAIGLQEWATAWVRPVLTYLIEPEMVKDKELRSVLDAEYCRAPAVLKKANGKAEELATS